jgi:hypothetical protein
MPYLLALQKSHGAVPWSMRVCPFSGFPPLKDSQEKIPLVHLTERDFPIQIYIF